MNQEDYDKVRESIKQNWNIDGRALGYKNKFLHIVGELEKLVEVEK